MDPELRLLNVAPHQYSVFTARQAIEAGFSPSAVKRRVDRGLLARLHRGVFVLVAVPIGWEQRVMAACLACGPHVAASFGSAAKIWGIADEIEIPEVTVPDRGSRDRRGIKVWRTETLERTTRSAFPVTPPMRTILDLAKIYDSERLERSLDRLHRDGWISMRRLASYLERVSANRRGSGVLREMVKMRIGARPIGSDLETILFRKLRRSGLPVPIPQFAVETMAGVRYIDLAYPEQRLAIELDGFERHAGDRRVFDDDRIRENELAELGWSFRRFTWTHVRKDPLNACLTIGRALSLEPRRWS